MSENNKDTSSLFSVKCKYIIESIFKNMKLKKVLNIIKYNKALQQRMDFSLLSYKYYYSIIIKIETISEFDEKLINVSDDSKQFFHIFYGHRKEGSNNQTKTSKIIIEKKVTSLNGLFEDCEIIKRIIFTKFNVNSILDMSKMFKGCSNIENILFTNVNTDNVINMSEMFSGCISLKNINLKKFNTKKVINMSGMFSKCISLESINLSNFITDKVVDMCSMFENCTSVSKLNVSNFNTNNLEKMDNMFSGCSSLKELNI